MGNELRSSFPTLLLMTDDIVGVVMLGAEGNSPVERWVAGARAAAAGDAAALARAAGAGRVVLATSETALADEHPDWPVEWDFDQAGVLFRFGDRLAEVMARFPANIYVYLGAGSAPLLPVETLIDAIASVRAAGPAQRAVVNNLHSTDWMVANCPTAIMACKVDLGTDNALGWVLKHNAGVEVTALPASAATRLDIDTPADVLLLGLHGVRGAALTAFLQAQPLANTRWLTAGRQLFTPGGRAALIGRVSSAVWAHVESNTQAWLRVFSEERGMTASGRMAAGRVKSVVGAHLLRIGPQAFFEELSEMVDAVFFDTRPVLLHAVTWPTPADRYASDLGAAAEIADPFLRELTAAAVAAPMPVVLGGHGVVAGDLYGLVAAAQAGRLA